LAFLKEKIKKMRILLITLVGSFLFSGCSTLNSVVKAKEEGKGTVQVYDVNMEEAWTLAKKSFRWGGADAIEEYQDEGYMLTSKGMNLVSSGSVMGAWIESTNNGLVRVTIISKRRISTQIATGMTEGRFHKLFGAGVDILKRGEKLPLSAPDVN
jgi:hypothetical protein